MPTWEVRGLRDGRAVIAYYLVRSARAACAKAARFGIEVESVSLVNL